MALIEKELNKFIGSLTIPASEINNSQLVKESLIL